MILISLFFYGVRGRLAKRRLYTLGDQIRFNSLARATACLRLPAPSLLKM
jgi:hypothetical protein